MIHLRHHEGDWRLGADRKSIETRGGDVIPLCTERKPVLGAQPFIRKGESEWLIAPVVFVGGSFRPLPNRDFILLTGSPSSTNEAFTAFLFD